MDQQGHRNRRKTRNINKKKQNANSNNNDMKEEEERQQQQQKTIPTSITNLNDEQQENFQEINQTKQTSPAHDDYERHPNRDQTPINVNQTERGHVVPAKPQASVAPVKQVPLTPLNNGSSNTSNHNWKTNGHSSPQHNIYTFSPHKALPPRFQQQQQQQRQAKNHNSQYRRRRGGAGRSKRSSFPPDSAERPNDFVPISSREQQQQQQQQQQDLSMNNGYSSESDILTDSPSTLGNASISPVLSTSTGSHSSLQRLDLVRSLATSHGLLDELVSIFDTVSFSSEELELILNKIATKHVLDKHDLQRLISTTKSDKTLERILDETYRSQAKILAIELQSEKNRTLELTKTNADMENTIRQLLQQQQQQQPNSMIQYQQMILPYQMHLRRLADENARLQHQLHAYSMMPVTLNELKQQQLVLSEQIRQLTIRNCALENEAAESEQASRTAAEIYKKADAQKQERIEQMISDINKYKKLDKELTNLRQKHSDSEKDFAVKLTEMTNQRDQLQTQCNQLKDKLVDLEKS